MKNELFQNKLVRRAVDLLGGQSALARACGKRQGHVWKWLHQEVVSAETAILLDRATNGAVCKEQLRPDIFSAAAVAQ